VIGWSDRSGFSLGHSERPRVSEVDGALSAGKLIGMITRTDELKVEPSDRAEKTVNSIMSDKLVAAGLDQDLFSPLAKMISISVGRIPVVDPRNAETIVGIITRADIGRAIERSPLRVQGDTKHSR